MNNTPTPRTDAVAERLLPISEKITEENASEKVGLVVRELLIHSTKLERELADANKLLDLINKCTPDLIRDCHLVERLTAERDAAIARAEQAEELLREIRDGEVNPEDEADKFLRDHVRSKLSEAIARAEKAERAIETLAKILSSCSRSRNDYAKNFRTSEVGRIKAESERARLREELEAYRGQLNQHGHETAINALEETK